MNYQEFITSVEEKIRDHFPEDYKIELRPVTKNNNIRLDALSIMKPEVNIAPTIYLNPYYHRFLDGVGLSEIVTDILLTYENYCPSSDIDLDSIMNYKKAREHLAVKLINAEKNAGLLKECPFVPFLDLAIVFVYLMEEKSIGNGMILIHNEQLDIWGITIERLYKDALLHSLSAMPPRLVNLFDMMEECCQEMGGENLTGGPAYMTPEEWDLCRQTKEAGQDFPYVLTNTEKNLGASALIYPRLLANLATALQSDLLLLPSSIHEFIVIPMESLSSAWNTEDFSELVRSVNETEVCDEEVLSDHAYVYYRESGMLSNGKQLQAVL